MGPEPSEEGRVKWPQSVRGGGLTERRGWSREEEKGTEGEGEGEGQGRESSTPHQHRRETPKKEGYSQGLEEMREQGERERCKMSVKLAVRKLSTFKQNNTYTRVG
jgi:hypothetical protein